MATTEKFKTSPYTFTDYLIEINDSATVSERIEHLIECIATLPDAAQGSRKLVKLTGRDGKHVFVMMPDVALEHIIGSSIMTRLSEPDVKVRMAAADETLLSQHQAQLRIDTPEDGSAIMIASVNGHLGAVEDLLNHGGDANAKTKNGWNAIMYAT